MKGALVTALVLALCAATASAKTDPRLAAIRKAVVLPVDDLDVDRPVAACLAAHLHDLTPIEMVTSKEDADAIFRVDANLPSATTRVLFGSMGGSPSAHLFVETRDGVKLWDDGAKLRRAIGQFGKLNTADGIKGVECGLADELLSTLRDAMRKARER